MNYKDPVLSAFVVDFYELAEGCMRSYVDDAYFRSYFGEEKPLLSGSLDGNDLANNFNYLMSMLTMAYFDYAKAGFDDDSIKEFYEVYNINCIKKTFLCWKCDITPIIKKFISISNPSKTGIGYMAIEGAVNPFVINKN